MEKDKVISYLKDELQAQAEINSSLEKYLNMTLTIKKLRHDRTILAWSARIGKIIFQQLTAGARPSTAPENIETDDKSFADNFLIEESPSVSYVQLCRGKIRIFC